MNARGTSTPAFGVRTPTTAHGPSTGADGKEVGPMLKKMALLAIAGTFCLAGVAHAGQTPFTITDTIDFRTGATGFTTTGPLCSSGTYADDIRAFGAPAAPSVPHSLTNNGANVIIRTVFTCADGSGTFNGLKHFQLVFSSDTSFTTKGQLELHGGTGAYVGLSGHGSVAGAVVNEVGGGFTTGVLH